MLIGLGGDAATVAVVTKVTRPISDKLISASAVQRSL